MTESESPTMMCNTMNELISVIIPVYNVEAYLEACVKSVMTQTYKNIEIILVDDGSPDNCPAMCDAYAAIDSRVRVIHKENGGLSSARNAGIDAASGDYLAFLDSDDLWSPYFLERLYFAITDTDADIAVCQFTQFEGDKVPQNPDKQSNLLLTKTEAFDCLFNEKNENMVIAPNKLYRRNIFKTIRYPVRKLHEDEAIIHEVIGASDRIVWIEEAHYFYRQTPGSITTAKFNLKRLDEMFAKEQRIAYFEAHEMHELAERTKRVYLNNLMRLYRTVQEELGNRADTDDICKKLHIRFCNLCTPKLIRDRDAISKMRFFLFRHFPKSYSKLEYWRLKKKGI